MTLKRKQKKIVGIILMIVGLLFVIIGYATLSFHPDCNCFAPYPCHCETPENPMSIKIIYLGVPISITGASLFIITTFKK